MCWSNLQYRSLTPNMILGEEGVEKILRIIYLILQYKYLYIENTRVNFNNPNEP